MAGRISDDDDLAYGERWDGERLAQERDRAKERDRFFTRVSTREPSRQAPRESRERVREAVVDERFVERRAPRPWEDRPPRERRYYDESPPRRPSPRPEERRVYLETEQDREYRDSSPIRHPTGFLRHQSSLDTFDRRPAQRLYDRDEYSPPARRRDHRPEPYEPIPLPRSRALPPTRIYAEKDYEEIRVPESHRYDDDELRPYPDNLREREIVRVRKHRERSGSRTSRARRYRSSSRHSSSRSSHTSSSSSETGGTAITAKSEYPKKGKTKIPIRLVSIRAIADLQYPHVIEGNTVIIQKALGQKNIDDLLKLSDDYKKADAELTAARSISGAVVEEHREEAFTIPPPAPPSLVVRAPAPPAIEIAKEAIVREASPTRGYTSYNTTTGPSVSCSYLTSRAPVVVEAGVREISDNDLVGPLTLISDRRIDHQHRHRSQSRGRELVRTERLPTGELVVYEEEIERVEEPRRGVRIEKDKKGPPPKLLRAMLATLT